MQTNIITLGGTVEGNNEFPVYTTFGVYEKSLGIYINALKALGHTWTQAQIDAFEVFLSSVSSNNWDLPFCFPFFGDTAECLKVPLLLDMGNEKYATVGDKDSYTTLDPNWSDFAVTNTNGLVIAAKSTNTGYLALPFSMKDLADYIGNDGYLTGSITVVGKPNYSGATRLFGVGNTGVGYNGEDFLYSLRDLSNVGSVQFYLFNAVTENYDNDSRYFRHLINIDSTETQVGTFDTVTEKTVTQEAKKYSETAAQNLKLCIGGNPAVDGSGVFGGSVSLTPDCSVRFLSYEMQGIDEDGYRTAVGNLCTTLGKID